MLMAPGSTIYAFKETQNKVHCFSFNPSTLAIHTFYHPPPPHQCAYKLLKGFAVLLFCYSIRYQWMEGTVAFMGDG